MTNIDQYQKLANLIFPEITETIEDLEKRFPKRDLPERAMVTRFAPSPTGFLHTGSLFAAMISAKFAHQTKGVFYIRLEDTDQKREIAGSGSSLITQLAKFGVIPDEGYLGEDETGKVIEKGNYGSYIQSKRADIYKVVIKYMISHNMAYPCFCSTEELNEMRKNQEAKKENFGYYGEYAKCSRLTPDEAMEKIKQGQQFVIRFRSHGDYHNKIEINDAIRGHIEMAQNDQHIIIYKSDGLPTYHFAHLVDDHFMRTTHITRGEEWMPSIPIHLELFDTMNWPRPVYCHLPVIMVLDNGNRRKLSKRKDPEAAVSYFLEQGYPTEGFMEYLYTIANSNYEAWRDEHPTEDKNDFLFSFDKMSLDGALFDLAKVKNLCKEKLSRLSTKTFASLATTWASGYEPELYSLINRNPEYFTQIVGIEREKENPRKDYEKFKDILPLIRFFYDDYYEEMVKTDLVFPENLNNSDIIKVINEYKQIFDLTLTEEDWFNQIKDVSVKCGFASSAKEWKKNKEAFLGHVGDVAAILRIIVTLRQQSPNLYYVMQIIGKNRVINRLDYTISKLQ